MASKDGMIGIIGEFYPDDVRGSWFLVPTEVRKSKVSDFHARVSNRRRAEVRLFNGKFAHRRRKQKNQSSTPSYNTCVWSTGTIQGKEFGVCFTKADESRLLRKM